MLKISEFFKKIQSKHTQELFVRSIIQSILKKYLSIEVPVENISFKSDSIILKGISQVARSQIFIKKEFIIKDINIDQSIKKFSDIR